jgi:transcriptional regulator with XRE-family HTH domain
MPQGSSTFSMILCQLLAQKMDAKGLTQKDFFQRSGISQATWSRINRGLSALTAEDLHSAARTLESPLPYLMEEAEFVSQGLPEMDVEVVEVPKNPRGPKAKKQKEKKDSDAGSVIVTVIATAALAFLISRILASK